jgi:hypothetical protein
VDKVELIRTMREAHQRVSSAIEHVPDDHLREAVMAGWTGKDVLAHMAWLHDHSARVIEALRAGRQPYERADASNSTDAVNQRTLREHQSDPPQLTRRAFDESFNRLLAALEPVTEEELFANDRWPWLDGEALVETILWDSSRHYDAHRDPLERLSHGERIAQARGPSRPVSRPGHFLNRRRAEKRPDSLLDLLMGHYDELARMVDLFGAAFEDRARVLRACWSAEPSMDRCRWVVGVSRRARRRDVWGLRFL